MIDLYGVMSTDSQKQSTERSLLLHSMTAFTSPVACDEVEVQGELLYRTMLWTSMIQSPTQWIQSAAHENPVWLYAPQ